MMNYKSIVYLFVACSILGSCSFKHLNSENEELLANSEYQLVVLGVAQDAGYPQANCKKSCCVNAWQNPSLRKMVACLGLRDLISGKVWLFDATPDFKHQLKHIKNVSRRNLTLDGIFLTHAHMGHYTGLMHLGREAMGAAAVTVYAQSRMKSFLTQNGPWSQLVDLNNIELLEMDHQEIFLSANLTVTPFEVPHRDEFSETVGFKIKGPNHSAIFIPDIDKWSKWRVDIKDLVKSVDYAFLDGTFYQNGEIWGRDMSDIPHPFIVESIEELGSLSQQDKAKVHFIHLNHTNPLLDVRSEASKKVLNNGFNIAQEFQIFKL